MEAPDILCDPYWAMEDFENAYRNWLLGLVDGGSHSILFDVLYDTEFEWDPDIPRDSGRASDGRYLRLRFAEEEGIEMRDEWLAWPCSFLEFLISLAIVIEEDIMYDPSEPDRTPDWFWLMMRNAGLDMYTDANMLEGGTMALGMVHEKVERILRRRYSPSGDGGLFPLKHPQMDQRKVEIWYQANAYFIEEYFS